MRDALMRLLEPPIEALDYELVDVEFAREGRGGVLRVYIDRPAASPGGVDATSRSGGSPADGPPTGHSIAITVDDCARVSHAVSEVLETEDPIKGHYSLEVSSPGFDRILRKREHFERFLGERILAELKLPRAGRRRFIGVLKSIVDDSIVVEVDGQAHTLPLAMIQKARLRPE
jgi:ribosome maturation factor RimP